jgi:dihydrodiol dehydrogenase / D-xylose 1-dehydrogenase (NADP)
LTSKHEGLFMKQFINWGILGPGGISRRFAEGIRSLSDAKVAAVGSRSLGRAQAFAKEFGIPKAYGSYQELVSDPEIDVIYIGTPIGTHYKHMLLCLNNGKAALCEKAFTVTGAQAKEIVELARKNKLFLMEAMWTPFLPVTARVREWLKSGAIGEVRLMTAYFGYRCKWEPNMPLFNPPLGGGALLDAGIYPISYASMIFGPNPVNIAAVAHIGETGVEEQFTAILGYDGGGMASLIGAVRTNTCNQALIYGTDGYIRVPDFLRSCSAEQVLPGKGPERYDQKYLVTGLNYEAAEVNRCLREAGPRATSCLLTKPSR